MKTYKGTDKDMRCYNGFQYELGKTVEDDGAVVCGDKGFHSCEAPFDVLRYFPNGKGNRYFEADADGAISRDETGDTSLLLVSSKLTLKTEIGFAGLVKAQIDYTREKATSGNAGGDGSNLAGGDWSNLAGGESSLLACRNGRAKGGLNSVIVLTQWEWHDNVYTPTAVKAEIVDGERIKADTWYELVDGELAEVKNDE